MIYLFGDYEKHIVLSQGNGDFLEAFARDLASLAVTFCTTIYYFKLSVENDVAIFLISRARKIRCQRHCKKKERLKISLLSEFPMQK